MAKSAPRPRIDESNNELNDASSDRALNTERDQTTTDLSQDVDSQERIRSLSVSHDNASILASQQRSDQMFQNAMQFTQNIQAITLQGMQNMIANAQRTEGQHVRHVDHTLIDLHDDDEDRG